MLVLNVPRDTQSWASNICNPEEPKGGGSCACMRGVRRHWGLVSLFVIREVSTGGIP